MNRSFRLSICMVILSMGYLQTLYAQDTSNTIGHVSIASPTAASLGKFGDIPVSYNTGIPQIGIPIYTVESGSLKLPISLSYHASGLKVQENASWVGAGWALNAGGAITRTVVGGPDDRGVSGYNASTNGHYSDYGYNNYQWIGGSGFGSVNGMVADDQGFEQGRKDAEPDLYFFNFGGYSGRFYFNDDRTPMLVPEQDFKIVPDLNNGIGGLGFQGFTVTTPDGVRYYFGTTGNNNASVSPIEITAPSTLQNSPGTCNMAVSSWFLNKIVSADGMDSITLNYQPEKYSYYTMAMYPVTNMQSGSFMDPADKGYNVVKNFVQGVRLSSINFPNGNITFNPSATARTDLSAWSNQAFTDVTNTEAFALGSIQISDNNGFCKKDSLYYGYFNDVNSYTINNATYGGFNIHSDAYRLRLDSLLEQTCSAGLKVPPYKFTYFSELVPRKLSFGIDHWGFSNGVINNQTLIPTYTLFYNGDITKKLGANRDASWPAMRGGSLNQITYPTGGYTQFTFESHDTYAQYNTYNQINKGGWSVGYGGTSQTTGTFSTDITSSMYELDISSAQTLAGGANLQIANPSGTIVQNISIASGASQQVFFNLSPSTTYTWTFYNHATGDPNGASAALYEWLATAVQGNVTVGGLRIKTVTSNDALTANNLVTSYAYNNGGTSSSGILYSRPVYVEPIRNDIYALVYGNIVLNGCQTPAFINPQGAAGTYYISGGSIAPLSTVQGNHIGYNQVQVSQAGNGYSIYRYYGSSTWDSQISDVCTRTIDITTCPLTIPNFPVPPQPFEFMRGQLKYEGQYNQAGQILKDVSYTYNYAANPIQTPGIIYVTVPGMYSYTGYLLQTAKKTGTQTVSTQYNPIPYGAVTSTNTMYYGSNYHNQPTRSVTTTSTGDSLVTNIKYAMDFRVSSCDAIPDSLTYYNNAVHADSILMFTNIATCPAGDYWTCRYDTFADFRRNVNLARIQYINYRRRSYSDTGLLASCLLTARNGADTVLKPILRLQQGFKNPPIESSEWKNLNLRYASFTKYDTSINPIGFVYPGRTQMINLQAPSATFTNAAVSGNTVIRDSRYTDETFYKFSAGNPQQVTGHDGVSDTYIWDYKNTHPVAKVANATVDQVAYTSFEADGNGSWTIGSTLRDAANAITGKQSYNLSNGTCSRAGLTSANSYVVSYWSKTGSAYTVTGNTATKQGKTINGWTYFEHTVTGTSSVSVSGSGDVDELRLYPSSAQMTTYTYSPLVGMTTACDVDNRPSYYIYDALGRLKAIKDQDGNIIKTLEYHYMGQ